VIGLLVVGITVNTGVAIKVFNDDKNAYIYENNITLSQTSSAEIDSFLSHIFKTLQIVAISSSGNSRQIIGISDFGLEGEKDIVEVKVFQVENGKRSNKQIFNYVNKEYLHLNSIDQEYFDGLDEKFPVGIPKEPNSVLLRNTSSLGGIPLLTLSMLFEKEFSPGSFVVARITPDSLLKILTSTGVYTMYLLDEFGNILVHPTINYILTRENFSQNPFIKEVISGKAQRGTKEFISEDGDAIIGAYTKIQNGNLILISQISKEKAFLASKKLIEKSILVSIGLILLFFIITILFSRAFTRPILQLYDSTKKVAAGDFSSKVKVKSNDEIGHLSKSFNLMTDEIQKLLIESKIKARMERELDTAKLVQATLFPESYYKTGPLEIAGFYTPASECGGDWWHHSENNENVYLWLGDATGHGVPAALVTSAACATASVLNSYVGLTPSEGLGILNNSIYDVSKGKMMMTFFLGSLNTKTLELTYSLASHETPIIFRPRENKYEVIWLETTKNPRLGQKSKASFKEARVKLQPGDWLFAYTDGLTDLNNPQGNALGQRNLLDILHKTISCSHDFQKVSLSLSSQIDDYRHGTDLSDDMTFFICKIA
jgi:sigma-B regulation protein RsbU (phosphoserine phosphatase)